MRDKRIDSIGWAAAVLFLFFSLGIVVADEKGKADTEKNGDEKKTDTNTATEGEKDDSEEKKKGPPESDDPNVKSGLRERRSQKQRLAEALQRVAEEKQRRREEREADEKRRREAIRRATEEAAAKRKQASERAKTADDTADNTADNTAAAIPHEERTTIMLQNGNSFEGIILLETDADITLKIEGGELTIDKALVKEIRRPPRQPSAKPPRKTQNPTQ